MQKFCFYRLLGLFILTLFCSEKISGQGNSFQATVKTYNFTQFKHGFKGGQGGLTEDAPCTNCYELADKRTLSSRTYQPLDNPNELIILQANGPINFLDNNGRFQPLDYSLSPVGGAQYAALNQPYPVRIDGQTGRTTLTLPGNQHFEYNKSVWVKTRLHGQTLANQVLFPTTHTAGPDGVIQPNVLPDMTRQLIALEGGVKTNYILDKRPTVLNQTVAREGLYVIEDREIELSNGHRLVTGAGTWQQYNGDSIWFGDLKILDAAGQVAVNINKPKIDYTKKDTTISPQAVEALVRQFSELPQPGYIFEFKQGKWSISTVIHYQWLLHPLIQYPLTIDPEVTVNVQNPGTFGFTRNIYCENQLDMVIPARHKLISMDMVVAYQATGLCCNGLPFLGCFPEFFGTVCGVSGGRVSVVIPRCYRSQEGGCAGGVGTCNLTVTGFDEVPNCVNPTVECRDITVPVKVLLSNILDCGGQTCATDCQRVNPGGARITMRLRRPEVSITNQDAGGSNIICGATRTVRLGATVRDAAPPYSYAWQWPSGSSTESEITVTPTTTTTYQLTVSDNCGTLESTRFVMFVFRNPVVSTSVIPPSCNGGRDGQITTTVDSTVTYRWSTGSTAPNLENIAQGLYTVTVTTGSGCSTVAEVQVGERAAAFLDSVQVRNASSGGGTDGQAIIFARPALPSEILNYTITGFPAQTSNTFTGLRAGVYTAKAITPSGCETSREFRVYETNCNPNIQISPDALVFCAGGALSIRLSGAETYNWSPATGLSVTNSATVVARPAETTTYTVRGLAGNCLYNLPITVRVLPIPNLSVTPSRASICIGENLIVQARGANSYIWMPMRGLTDAGNNAMRVEPSETTTYTVIGESDGCSSQTEFTVIVRPRPNLTVTPVRGIAICSGETARLTAGGADFYRWFASSGDTLRTPVVNVRPSSTTTYTVIGYLDGCTSTATATITVNPLPELQIAPQNPTFCFGQGGVRLTAFGAFGFSWAPALGLSSTNAQTVIASPDASTTYTVTGIDGRCTAQKTVRVEVRENPQVQVRVSHPDICEGGFSVLTARGADTYFWEASSGRIPTPTQNQILVTPPFTTTYTVTGSNAGCVERSVITVNVTPTPTVEVFPTQPVLCADSPALLVSTTGASTFTWFPNTGITPLTDFDVMANPDVTTTYTVTGFINDCFNTRTVTIIRSLPILIEGLEVVQPLCGQRNGEIRVRASGGYQTLRYSIDGIRFQPNPVFSQLRAGDYTLVIQDLAGCEVTRLVKVRARSVTVVVDEIQVINPSCAAVTDGSIQVKTRQSGLQFAINGEDFGDSPLFTDLGAGRHIVTVRDARDCTRDFILELAPSTPVQVRHVDVVQPSTCAARDAAIVIRATGGRGDLFYSIDGDVYQPSPTFNNLPVGQVLVRVMDMAGCLATREVNIPQPESGVRVHDIALLRPSCSGRADAQIRVTASGPAPLEYSLDNRTWQRIPIFERLRPGAHTVYIKTPFGCLESYRVEISDVQSLVINQVLVFPTTNCATSDGQIRVTAEGGHEGLLYSLDGINFDQSFVLRGLQAGTYTVFVRDAGGCIISRQATVPAGGGSNIVLDTVTFGGARCAGQTGGFIRVFARSNLPLRYSIDGSRFQESPIFSNLPAGTYNITIRNQLGCIRRATAVIADPPAIRITRTHVQNPTCGGQPGNIVIEAISQRGILQFSLPNRAVQNSGVFNDLLAGTYTVTITDVNGCTLTQSLTITSPPVLELSVTKTDPTLPNTANGVIRFVASGGQPPYRYALNNGNLSGQQVYERLPAGQYTVRVVDANQCQTIVPVTLIAPALICEIPSGLLIQNVLQSTATLRWNGLSGVNYYEIHYRIAGESAWQRQTSTLNFINLSGLEAGKRYEVRLRTVCSGNRQSEFSTITVFNTLPPSTVCEVPALIFPTPQRGGVLALTWTAVQSATTYQLQYRLVGATTWDQVTVAQNAFRITGLRAGGRYQIRVRAICNSERSAWSPLTTVTLTNSREALLPQNDSESDEAIAIYPNPTKDKFTVNFTTNSDHNLTIAAYDVTGRCVYTLVVPAGLGAVDVEVSTWAAGVYNIQFIHDGQLLGTRKLLIVK